MTRRLTSILFSLIFFTSTLTYAQISNLLVNGSNTTFTMTSGDSVSWTYHVSPAGATAQIQIWYDANSNGSIDAGTDLIWQIFPQTDGVTDGGDGPPDNDGTSNGVVVLDKIPIGLAPGKYVMSFSQGGTTLTMTGTVTALSSPAHTISGTVTVPAGRSAANIFVGMESSNKEKGPGWWSLTNGSGNFQIAMGPDTAGGPWRVSVRPNPYPPAVITPDVQPIYITGNPTGINFSIVAAVAQVVGTVRDELGNTIPSTWVALSNQYVGQANSQQANQNGFYQVGLTLPMLSGNTGFAVTAYFEGDAGTTDRLDGMGVTGTIAPGDSIVRNLVAYAVNSTISGMVKVNGSNPGFPIQLAALNVDSGQSVTWSDGATGEFSFPVSNKIYNYAISSIGGAPLQSSGQQIHHPGQTGITVNFTMTDVREAYDPFPQEWSLGQNYPNPFNPTTEIKYTIPVQTRVSLAVYSILGVKVADLVNSYKNAGTYTTKLDGNNLPSGVYFYRLQAGKYVETKKMVLMK